MENFFDKAMHYLGKTSKDDVFILNVGAMDGVMFDEMIGYTNMYNFKGLYVEPIPYLFDRLKRNLKEKKGNKFENSAISDYNGQIEMLTIKREAIDNCLIHGCFYGMSAVYPPRNGLGSEGDRETVEKYGEKINVPCITFETLLKKHQINNFDVLKIDAEGHDYEIFKQVNLLKHNLKLVRLEWSSLLESEKEAVLKQFSDVNFLHDFTGQDIVGISKDFYNELKGFYACAETNPSSLNIQTTFNTNCFESKTTVVTGLWNINRHSLQEGWSRTFDHYLEKFDELLDAPQNMIIFGDRELESFVMRKRNPSNTQFIVRPLDWFKNNDYYNIIQKIRTNQDWFNQAGWLQESTQARLEMYNPLVMSKVFLLNDAKILDKFDSEHLYWVDAGLTNTVHPGYFTHDHVLDKISKQNKGITFVCFPYEANNEIHGFNFDGMCKLAGENVNKVARGGFFGGPKKDIERFNSLYYSLLFQTLDLGFMGTEESLFTILLYQHPELFEYAEIQSNGLISTYFENVKTNSVTLKREKMKNGFGKVSSKPYTDKAGLYVISFNSPKQFETLINSMELYDKEFLQKTTKFLLDNSTDDSTYSKYQELCNEYGFEHIKKDNLGICGGRQFIAEHFNQTDLEYMFFFEDDMFFYPHSGKVCRSGFNRFVDNLYNKVMKIMNSEEFDFLKLSFSEFYGDNSTQWSWYNVPQIIREKYWPDYNRLPVQGIDPNSPRTQFKSIKTLDGLSYATGEIYYCNWPQIVSKQGNKKMFLETTWARPHEQTWMSHIFQLTKDKKIHPGILLLSPTEHNRFDHYSSKLRKES